MKKADWKAAGLAALVSLLAPHAYAADILFSEATSICVRNHADPEKALSAADVTGWGTGLTAGATQLLKEQGLHLNPHTRSKEINGARLSLRVDASLQSGTTVRSCNVIGYNLSWGEALEAAKNYFGAPPSQENSQVVQWIYIERDSQRLYFRGDQQKHLEELAGGATLHALSVVHDPAQSGPPAIMYKEITKAEAH